MSDTDTALPIDKLGSYLADHIEDFGTLQSAEKFSEGQSNPTYLLVTDREKYVLRKKPGGPILPSAHAVDREFRVMSALASTAVPVPTMHLLCEDEEVIGTIFYVMEFIDGDLHLDARLQSVAEPARRGAIYDQMNLVLADLHKVDVAAVGLDDYGRPGNYFERQLNRWSKQYSASETEQIDAMNQLMEWLPAQMPEDDGRVSLIHGDYRLDNMMFSRGGSKIIALLDWELST
ncbi:MAG: phosphotransferase family protein, partial [Gammaproteobacteria bacterium]